MAAKTRLIIGFKDDVGLERDNMEDAAGWFMAATNLDVRRKGAIFVVADGVGGQQAGEVASNRAVKTILKEFYSAPYDDTISSLRYAINIANDTIYKEAHESNKETMATTVACVVVRDGLVTLANVGDSRVYILRAGQMRQLSEDHSWVNEQIRSGTLTPAAAKTNPYRNVITRSLGSKPKVEADIETLGALLNDDRLLLCSDGLYEGVPETDMLDVIQRLPATQAAEELVDMANRAGGSDNVTVLIIEAHVEGQPDEAPIKMEKPVEQQPASLEPGTQPSDHPEEGAVSDGPVNVEKEAPQEKIKEELPAPEDFPPAETPSNHKDEPDQAPLDLRQEMTTQKVSPYIVPPGEANSKPIQPPAPPSDISAQPSIPSTVLHYRAPLSGESSQESAEVLPHRVLAWEWGVNYQASGRPEPFLREKLIKLPNGMQVTLGFRIKKEHFLHTFTRVSYNYPLAFDLTCLLEDGPKHLIKSKGIIGAGFYNSISSRISLQEIYKKNYEILASPEEIYMIHKANPLIFATIDLVEFESVHQHQVEQDFLTILQVQMHFHIQL